MAVKVSVVIPVYNVERYLRQTLDSVCAQTLHDIEIILVDDGSTDQSPAIMNEYARRDGRIKVLIRKHSDGGACRNAGMEMATGEYLSFLDSDDCFAPHMLEVLLRGAEQANADIVCCQYVEFVDGAALPTLDGAENVVWTDETLDGKTRVRPTHLGDVTWDKLYRRAFIQQYGLRYLEQPTTNDATFVWSAVSCAQKIVATKSKYIAYRRHRGSTQGRKARYPECGIRANRAYCEQMKRLGVIDCKPWLWRAYLSGRPQSMLWYLATMSTAEAYRRAYKEILLFFCEEPVLEACVAVEEDYYVRRVRRMVNNDIRERVQRRVECLLAPLTATVATSGGAKRELIYCVNRFVKLAFDFEPTVRAFPQWVKKRFVC